MGFVLFKENLKASYLTVFYIRMNSGALLRAGAGLRGRIQVRGRAVQNWKRPTMDEYGVPTESWAVVNARNQKKYNGMLAVGLAFSALHRSTVGFLIKLSFTLYQGILLI